MPTTFQPKSISDYFTNNPKAIIKAIPQNCLKSEHLELDFLREDLMYPQLTGNKYRKLKYHLLSRTNIKSVVTVGGPFSNHLHAMSVASKLFGFKLIALVRKAQETQTATLQFAKDLGVRILFLEPSVYRDRYLDSFKDHWLKETQSDLFIPEGGGGILGVKGCKEILRSPGLNIETYDYVIALGGTGTMLAGMASFLQNNATATHLVGISALKKEAHLMKIVQEYAPQYIAQGKLTLMADRDFGGIGKWDDRIIDLMRRFDQHSIYLDQVYTAKLVHYTTELIKKSFFKKRSRLLLVHSGGQQGRSGLFSTLKPRLG